MQLSGGEEEAVEVCVGGVGMTVVMVIYLHALMGEKIQSLFGGKGTFAQRDKVSSPSECAR